MSWLPIESAPKDEDVLVYCPAAAVPNRIAMRCSHYDEPVWLDTGCVRLIFLPSHWKPLPEPPTDDRWELTEAGRAMRGGK